MSDEARIAELEEKLAKATGALVAMKRELLRARNELDDLRERIDGAYTLAMSLTVGM